MWYIISRYLRTICETRVIFGPTAIIQTAVTSSLLQVFTQQPNHPAGPWNLLSSPGHEATVSCTTNDLPPLISPVYSLVGLYLAGPGLCVMPHRPIQVFSVCTSKGVRDEFGPSCNCRSSDLTLPSWPQTKNLPFGLRCKCRPLIVVIDCIHSNSLWVCQWLDYLQFQAHYNAHSWTCWTLGTLQSTGGQQVQRRNQTSC